MPLLRRAGYRAQHASIRVPILVAQEILRALILKQDKPDHVALEEARRRYYELLTRDLDNVEAGHYPASLLAVPFGAYVRQLPHLLFEVVRVLQRMRRRDFKDLPADVDLSEYPHYFRRTFHWQTDGYLSRRSAMNYDVGVEFIFLGVADVMRRQIIPPIQRYAPGAQRLLDVACGTGHALRQIGAAFEDLECTGLDLSPFYLEVAAEQAQRPMTFLAGNAEHLPFPDDSFDVVTSVFLFHELPRSARRRVLAEMRRVLQPEGLLVIQDSAQISDSPQLSCFQERFTKDLHEPFFSDYIRDDLGEALRGAGFQLLEEQRHFVSKIVVAT